MLRQALIFARSNYDRLPPVAQRFALYALCGAAALALDFVVFSIALQTGAHYQLANFFGALCGLILSFVLNRAFTFRILDAPWRRLALFCAVGVIGYVLGSATLHLLVERLHLSPYLAKALSMIVVIASQFSLNSVVTFRPRT
jgi:putative flippase GtrA